MYNQLAITISSDSQSTKVTDQIQAARRYLGFELRVSVKVAYPSELLTSQPEAQCNADLIKYWAGHSESDQMIVRHQDL